MAFKEELVEWDRLVRYIPRDRPDQVRYGQPILGDDEDIASLATHGNLQVEVLSGDGFLEAKLTGQTERVGKLLGPLTPNDVPIIRCIGLNYKTHSKLLVCRALYLSRTTLETQKQMGGMLLQG